MHLFYVTVHSYCNITTGKRNTNSVDQIKSWISFSLLMLYLFSHVYELKKPQSVSVKTLIVNHKILDF